MPRSMPAHGDISWQRHSQPAAQALIRQVRPVRQIRRALPVKNDTWRRRGLEPDCGREVLEHVEDALSIRYQP